MENTAKIRTWLKKRGDSGIGSGEKGQKKQSRRDNSGSGVDRNVAWPFRLPARDQPVRGCSATGFKAGGKNRRCTRTKTFQSRCPNGLKTDG